MTKIVVDIEENPAYAHFEDSVCQSERRLNEKRGIIVAPPVYLLAMVRAGNAIGVLCIVNDWMAIQALRVNVANRGHGIGSAILRAAEEEACKRNCVGVHVSTISEATSFFEKHGYAKAGEIPDSPRGKSTYLYIKRLDS
ncbi:MAG TPA: GNAT family N-acetyltransferase [Alphaproteobacteria bacterium]|nr:GNAT family N-acetyltransferase [Alphaproteobacteria bacterium]